MSNSHDDYLDLLAFDCLAGDCACDCAHPNPTEFSAAMVGQALVVTGNCPDCGHTALAASSGAERPDGVSRLILQRDIQGILDRS